MSISEPFYSFQAIKGIQANKEFFVSMVPLKTISQLFVFSDDELSPEIRAQRTLNKSRIPEMKRYILTNPNSYIFSSLTVSVDSDIIFQPIDDANPYMGSLKIPMSAKFLINDGQHRKAAIEAAVRENPSLKYEHISVVFYHDLGLKHSQQMFSDLNRYAIRPTKSLNVLYDDRDPVSRIVRVLVSDMPFFNELVELEKTSISNRSKKLFTLSAIYHGTHSLLKDVDNNRMKDIATRFWQLIHNNIYLWSAVEQDAMKASEVRRDYICCLGVTLQAFGMAGNKLIKQYPSCWEEKMGALSTIDWNKNSPMWENLVVVSGKVVSSKTTENNLSALFYDIMINGR